MINYKQLLCLAVGFLGGAVCSSLYYQRLIARKEAVIEGLGEMLDERTDTHEEPTTVEDYRAEYIPTDYHTIYTPKESENETQKNPEGTKTGLNVIDEDEAADLIQKEGYSLRELTYYGMSDDLMENEDAVPEQIQFRVINTLTYERLLSAVDDTIFYVQNESYHIVYEVHTRPGMSWQDHVKEMGYDDE